MEKRILGPVVETALEVFFKLTYVALIDLEWFLAEKNVIGAEAKDGVYDELDFPWDHDELIH